MSRGSVILLAICLGAGHASLWRDHCMEQIKETYLITAESVALWALHPEFGLSSFKIFLGRIEKRATVRSTKQKGRCLFINEASKTLASSTNVFRFTHQFSHSSSKATCFGLLLSPGESSILFQTPHPLEFKSWCVWSIVSRKTSCLILLVIEYHAYRFPTRNNFMHLHTVPYCCHC